MSSTGLRIIFFLYTHDLHKFVNYVLAMLVPVIILVNLFIKL